MTENSRHKQLSRSGKPSSEAITEARTKGRGTSKSGKGGVVVKASRIESLTDCTTNGARAAHTGSDGFYI